MDNATRHLEELIRWHMAQAVGWESAAATTAMDSLEPVKSSLLRSAQQHRAWAHTLQQLLPDATHHATH